MIGNIYAVFDSKAQIHMEPFRAVSHAVAVRGFSDAANNPQSPIGKHPEDYSLFCLGTFDDEKGVFSNLDRAINLATASGLLKV